MTAETLIATWQTRAAAYRDVDARVEAAALCEQIVADLTRLVADRTDEWLTLEAAADWSGFSARHLRRRIRDGTLRATGRGDTLRILRDELPRKASTVAPRRVEPHLVGAKAEQVVRDSVGTSNGTPR
jgi:hypothetical protein